MNITVNRLQFAEALSAVMPAVPARGNSAIIKYIKLDLTAEALTLCATDTEVGIRYRFPGAVTMHGQPGSIMLHPERAAAVVREAKADTITIKRGDTGGLRFECQSNWWELSIPGVDDFPDVPAVSDAEFMEIPANELRTAIQRTIIASDGNSANYALQGVCFEIRGGGLALVATDSKRLAALPVSVEAAGQDRQALIPGRALKLLSHVLNGDDEHARLSLRPSDAVLECGPATIHCRQNQGRFPPWRQVIPTDFRMTVNLPVDRLNRAVRQSMAVMNKENSGVAFEFSPGTLCVTAEGKEVGLADIRINIEADQKLGITFDAKYVTDFLKQLEPAGNVTLRMAGPNAPALFQADGDYQYVIMPLARDE